jgi:hypothetical protein
MKRLSRREQILTGLCLLVVLFVGAPAIWDALAQRGPSPAESKRRLSAAKEERAAHAAVLAKLEHSLQRLAERRPPSSLSARAVADLDRRARKAGIHLREVKPLPPRPLEGATAVPLQVTFAAPFPRAARFLAELRADPGGLAVDRAVIAASTANSDQVTVNLRVMLFSLDAGGQETTRGRS